MSGDIRLLDPSHLDKSLHPMAWSMKLMKTQRPPQPSLTSLASKNSATNKTCTTCWSARITVTTTFFLFPPPKKKNLSFKFQHLLSNYIVRYPINTISPFKKGIKINSPSPKKVHGWDFPWLPARWLEAYRRSCMCQ